MAAEEYPLWQRRKDLAVRGKRPSLHRKTASDTKEETGKKNKNKDGEMCYLMTTGW